MTFLQRTTQYFFLFLGVVFVVMFAIRWFAPDARFFLWQVLCPPNSHIELVPGVAELEPGEVVSAYEVVCAGEGIGVPLDDFQLILVESGFSLGTAIVLAVIFGWVSTRKAARQG
ncbi:MAG: hypothetical protein HUU38_21755 [Anaerolineales bacterium]|nr:hypothetical protein [Anaerolineales bacterium]